MLMEIVTKEIIIIPKRMDLEFMNSIPEQFIKEIIEMINSMVKEKLNIKMEMDMMEIFLME